MLNVGRKGMQFTSNLGKEILSGSENMTQKK